MDYFNNFSLFNTKIFKSKFIGLIVLVFSIFLFNPIDSYAYIGEGNGVEFADISGNVITSFNYDYNVNVYVENCKYIYIYFDTKTIRNENYNLFLDFAFTYNRPYSIGFNVLNMFQDEIPVTNFNARIFNPDGQPDGATSYFNRYHLDVDFTSVATKGHVRLTIELPDVLNIYFYSVYNRYLSGPEFDDVGNSDVIENNNQNTDKIIENQNQNTDKEIESQKVCTYKNIYFNDKIYGGFLNSDGSLSTNLQWGLTDYIETTGLNVITSYNSSVPHSCFYDKDKVLISCIPSNYPVGTVALPNGTKFVRLSIRENELPMYAVKVCKNGNQAIDDSINDLNDKLFDDEPLNESVIDDFFSGIRADFTTDTPISDLILMPFTLLESYSDGISSTCSSFSLGSLFGTNLLMPCIDLENILGSTFWALIDMLFSVFMIYEISMLVISIFDSITSLDDSFQLLYSPRHGDMSRVGRGHSRGLY